MCGESAPTGTKVADKWYSEEANYEYTTGKPKKMDF